MLGDLGRAILTAIAITSAVTPGQADAIIFKNGEQLYKLCLGDDATPAGRLNKTAVSYYVAGISDVIAKAQQYKTLPTTVCVPEGATIRAVTVAVCGYIASRRGIGPTGHESGADLVALALREAYPCH
jgi:Rap1a immunity proteins